MRRLSKKRTRDLPARRQLTAKLLEEHNYVCQIDGPGCTRYATCLHERRKRSSNGDDLLVRNVVVSCAACNHRVECEPAWARLARSRDGRSLVVREGDPEWELLGRRARKEVGHG